MNNELEKLKIIELLDLVRVNEYDDVLLNKVAIEIVGRIDSAYGDGGCHYDTCYLCENSTVDNKGEICSECQNKKVQ